MKTVVLLGDGMGDFPIEEFDNKTPLQIANIPTMRKISANSEVRLVNTVPENLPPGSDVANMAILGYDASKNYTGRAPIEAAGADIPMKDNDIAFRCNLVTIENGIMIDYSAGHISTSEASELIKSLQSELGSDCLNFHNGVQYRHLLIWKNGPSDLLCVPPHEISDKHIDSFLPEGKYNEQLIKIMEDSKNILTNLSLIHI